MRPCMPSTAPQMRLLAPCVMLVQRYMCRGMTVVLCIHVPCMWGGGHMSTVIHECISDGHVVKPPGIGLSCVHVYWAPRELCAHVLCGHAHGSCLPEGWAHTRRATHVCAAEERVRERVGSIWTVCMCSPRGRPPSGSHAATPAPPPPDCLCRGSLRTPREES